MEDVHTCDSFGTYMRWEVRERALLVMARRVGSTLSAHVLALVVRYLEMYRSIEKGIVIAMTSAGFSSFCRSRYCYKPCRRSSFPG